ncbi:MAG: hypothetical protein ACLVAA_11805 [Ruthenibacterium sp.]
MPRQGTQPDSGGPAAAPQGVRLWVLPCTEEGTGMAAAPACVLVRLWAAV